MDRKVAQIVRDKISKMYKSYKRHMGIAKNILTKL